jgi:hypothetical protein
MPTEATAAVASATLVKNAGSKKRTYGRAGSVLPGSTLTSSTRGCFRVEISSWLTRCVASVGADGGSAKPKNTSVQ